MFERVLQGEGVDDRREHAHLVRGRPVHAPRLVFTAADEIAGADYDRKLDAEVADFLDFERDVGERVEVDAVLMFGGERLAGELEQNSIEAGFVYRNAFNLIHRSSSSPIARLSEQPIRPRFSAQLPRRAESARSGVCRASRRSWQYTRR